MDTLYNELFVSDSRLLMMPLTYPMILFIWPATVPPLLVQFQSTVHWPYSVGKAVHDSEPKSSHEDASNFLAWPLH